MAHIHAGLERREADPCDTVVRPADQPYRLTSGDGRYVWTVDLQGELTVYPLDGSPPQPVAGLLPGDVPANWANDSKHLYVYENDIPVRVFKIDLASGSRTLAAQFNPKDPLGFMGVRSLRMTPDGEFGAYSYMRALSQLYLVRDLSAKH